MSFIEPALSSSSFFSLQFIKTSYFEVWSKATIRKLIIWEEFQSCVNIHCTFLPFLCNLGLYAWQPSPEVSLVCAKLLETAKSGVSNKDKYLQSTIRFVDKHLSLSSSIAVWSTDTRKAFGCVLEFEVGKLSTSPFFIFVEKTRKQGYDIDSGVEFRTPLIIEEFLSCWQYMIMLCFVCGDYGMQTLLTHDWKINK